MTARGIVAACVALLLCFAAFEAAAQVPQLINFQGKVDSAGGTVSGTRSMTFAIYGGLTGGAPLWTETQPSVAVTGGVFSVLLGSVRPVPDSIFARGGDRFLGVQIAAQAEISPRFRLTSTPYAYKARLADSVAGGGGVGGSGVAGYIPKFAGTTRLDTSKIYQDTKGFVGIGRTAPIVGQEVFGVQSPATTGYGGMYVQTSGPSGQPFYGLSTGTAAAWHFLDGADSAKMKFYNNGVRMTLAPGGNVGIGTTAPAARLDVAGDIRLSGNLTYTAPRTGYVSGTAWATITPLPSTSSYSYSSGVYNNGTVGAAYYFNVQIPDGATLTEVVVYGYDGDAASEMGVTMARHTLTSSSGASLGGTTSGLAFAGGAVTLTVVPTGTTVSDNSLNAFYLQVSLPPTVNVRIYSWRAKYTYTEGGGPGLAGPAAGQ